MSVRIEHAEPGDLPSIIALLGRCGLPEAGLGAHIGTFLFVAKQDERPLGCAALELHGNDALFRSLAVCEHARYRGLGRQLLQCGLETARRLGVKAVYLLTDTAEEFFARRGFEETQRTNVPASVRCSSEFRYAGCSDATVMVWRPAKPACPPWEGRRQSTRPLPGVKLRDLAVVLRAETPPRDLALELRPVSCD